MTIYNYVCDMQELCLRATNALRVLGDDGMQKFYAAAEIGYAKMAEDLNAVPVEKAAEQIHDSEINAYLNIKEYVEQKEQDAAYKIKKDYNLTNKMFKEAEKDYEEEVTVEVPCHQEG